MNKLVSKIRTAVALGVPNLARVAGYRLSIKLGINQAMRIHAHLPVNQLFFAPMPACCNEEIVADATGKYPMTYFGWYRPEYQALPNWQKNPFNGSIFQHPERPWWQLPDFDSKIGDIKIIWEPSRFDWVLSFAKQTVQGKKNALDELNHWLSDWCVHNPAYCGPNWKCGQEASIRVMHLAFAALLLQQHEKTTSALQTLLKAHLQRIAPTIQYAIAQDNNHGTSEAAALFIGGSWLELLGDKKAAAWTAIGRKWLENRSARLIESDGSFSQYSINYHRVMLDTYSMAEYWRDFLQLKKFSCNLYQQLEKASNWLYQIVQPETGDAPNLGANDGARLLPLTSTDYRDFRPSVQLAMALFLKKNAYGDKGSWNNQLTWLNLPVPQQAASLPASGQFSQGGYSLLRQGRAFVLLRFPNFLRFRPSHADALHVDFWLNGENLLRDGGSYSYNAGDEVTEYFGGTASHNTIQFDDRDQMPKLSRFLFGEWLKASNICSVHEQDGVFCASAAYSDYQGARHHRTVRLASNSLQVQDVVSGFRRKAVLRWRLHQSEWVIHDRSITNGQQRLAVDVSVPVYRFEIVDGWESRYYWQKTSIPVLEIEIHQPGRLTTTYLFNQ